MKRRLSLVLAAAAAITAVGAPAAIGAFVDGEPVPGNAITTAADWTAPVVAAAAIGKASGGDAGYIAQAGSYFVYASISDGGNPPSGISTATADVSSVTDGQTTVALSSGSFSAGGAGYNYRSASLTADPVIAEGTYSFSIGATDAAGYSTTRSGLTVIVDNTAPAGSDLQTANASGGTAGKAEPGDTITFTFSDTMDPGSVLAGWQGAATTVVVRIKDGLGGDTLEVWDQANSAQLPLGIVTLGLGYVLADRTFGVTGTASTMVRDGASITITLGTASGDTSTAVTGGSMSWAPSAAATDRAGNACSSVAAVESGPSDVEF